MIDVLLSYKGLRISVELKREFAEWSDSELVDAYGAQTMSYQGTNILLCIPTHSGAGANPPIPYDIIS